MIGTIIQSNEHFSNSRLETQYDNEILSGDKRNDKKIDGWQRFKFET